MRRDLTPIVLAAGDHIGGDAFAHQPALFGILKPDDPLAGGTGILKQLLHQGGQGGIEDHAFIIDLARIAARQQPQTVQLPRQRLQVVTPARHRLESRDAQISEGAAGHWR